MKISNTISMLLCALLLVFYSFQSLIIVINYTVNKQEIIDRYCVNKAKPELKCDGKCHLSKQLAENTDLPKPTQFPKQYFKFQKIEFAVFKQTHFFNTIDQIESKNPQFDNYQFSLKTYLNGIDPSPPENSLNQSIIFPFI